MPERYHNEIKQLSNLAEMLKVDRVLPVRLSIERVGLDFRSFKVNLSGLRSLVRKPHLFSRPQDVVSDSFKVLFSLPGDYPLSMPNIRFDHPIPFHPHIWTDGRICWGTLGVSRENWMARMLVDWLGAVVEYLQYDEVIIRINEGSPANIEALDWWRSNSRGVRNYVSAIDMARFRNLIEEARASVS